MTLNTVLLAMPTSGSMLQFPVVGVGAVRIVYVAFAPFLLHWSPKTVGREMTNVVLECM